MDNKKFNMFALIMIVVMSIFSIYTAIGKNDAKDGLNGIFGLQKSWKTHIVCIKIDNNPYRNEYN